MKSVADLRILPGTARAIRLLREWGYLIIVISNQSGIARGLLTEKDLELVQEELSRQLASSSAFIDSYYHCPHFAGGKIKKYSIECNCRKPKPGLFLRAARDFDIDLSRSWSIGDRIRDVEAGIIAGTKGGLVRTGYGRDEELQKQLWSVQPDFIANNLYDAALQITGKA